MLTEYASPQGGLNRAYIGTEVRVIVRRRRPTEVDHD